MPRPKTKTELLDAAEAQYAKLDSLIESMSSDDQHTHFDPSITQIGKEAHWARDKNRLIPNEGGWRGWRVGLGVGVEVFT